MCRFTIPWIPREGVYLIRVNGSVKYVGECANLGHRFNTGYGNISPRNCYVGGQPMNCRINHHIYEAAKDNSEIKLHFHETNGSFEVERQLIEKLKPEWNISRGEVNILPGDSDCFEKQGQYRDNEYCRTNHGDGAGLDGRSSCRDEVLAAAQSIVKRKGRNQFTVQEVVEYMKARQTKYPESTIRTHITSRCCVNARSKSPRDCLQ